MSVIANTTVISNFASINQLDLLRRLFGALYISTEVYEEIRIGLEEGYQFYAGIDQMIHPFVHDGWIRLTSMADQAEIALYGELPSRLHRGEASCLVIARHRGVTADLHRWLFDEYLTSQLEKVARGDIPCEEAQTLLMAIKDQSALSQNLLARLREAGSRLRVSGASR
jgi:predicted nucleic acid-binding protein